MYKYIVIYNIILIAFIKVNTISALKIPDKTLENKSSQADKNKTNQIITEGGSLIPTNPLTLSNENHTLLNNLEILSDNKEKSVVPRKGVVYNPAEDVIEHDKSNQSVIATPRSSNESISHVELIQSNKTVFNDSSLSSISTQKINITKSHKPLILSHEALAKMDELNHLHLDENEPDKKVQSMKVGSHPDMIMPIVITILVVPMFAVVGYMALKRGQEAWKNRHYKRMDFLLDGMYND